MPFGRAESMDPGGFEVMLDEVELTTAWAGGVFLGDRPFHRRSGSPFTGRQVRARNLERRG